MDTQRKRKLDDEPESTTTVTVITPTPTPSPPPASATKQPPPAPVPTPSDEAITPELLRMYYDRFFPCSLFMQWLGSGGMERLRLREFSFTLKDDIYIRYLSFANRDELKAALVSKVPYKIDIGAVFNASVSRTTHITTPAMHTQVSQFLPVEKELVFDVDMTDYDDVRRCCSSAQICERCWPLMAAAQKVVDHMLRTDFGFKHILWVYSGRRGIHAWVCDARARRLSNELRTAIVEYLSVSLGKDHGKDNRARLQLTHPLHPSIETAYDTLLPYYERQVELQDHFQTAEGRAAVLEYFDDSVRPYFLFSDADSDSLDKWEELRRKVNMFVNARPKPGQPHNISKNKSVTTALHRIVLGYTYPRLDVNVSKQLNHLLKAPFCVHPKTGRVCVPVRVEEADTFDPFEVPTLEQLERELNEAGEAASGAAEASEAGSRGWERTRLRPYIEHFKEFVHALQEEARKVKLEEKVRSNTGVEDW